ncbi:MAG: AI-2E family transporter [Chloroflexi bacterium]|nr:AI-2E family transporter [Chloroflexota bacterium]
MAFPGHPESSRMPSVDPPLTGGDRRALRALIYLSLTAMVFVVIWFLAQLVAIFSDILSIFFLAWLLAFLVDPIATRLVRANRWLPRHLAVLMVFGLLFAAMVGPLLLLTGALASSISDLSRSLPQLRADLPQILEPVQRIVDDIGLDRLDLAQGSVDLLDQFSRSTDAWLEPIRDAAVASVTVFGTFSLIVFLALYIAADGAQLRTAVLQLIPGRFAGDIELLETSVARSFGGFVRGQVLLGIVYGAFAGLTTVLLGLPYLPLIAVMVGLLHAVPFFGPFVSWIPPVLAAVLYRPDAIGPAILIMAIGMLVTMNGIQPRLMGSAVGLNPAAVLASVLIGARLYGVLGAIFAVPVVAVIAAVIAHWSRSRIRPEVSAAAALEASEAASRAEEDARPPRSRIRRRAPVQKGDAAAP